MKTISAILSVLALSVAAHISATEAIFMYQSISPGPTTYIAGGAGFAFVPLTTLSVTSLGFGGSGLAQETYEIELWNSSGTLLGAAPVSTGSPVLNQTHYASIAPLTLAAGQTYYLGVLGQLGAGWVGQTLVLPPAPASNGTISVSPDITYLGGATSMAYNGGIPTSINPTAFYINANFQYTVVPEPSLFGPGMACGVGLILARRRRTL
jgi:hypothetical protein